MTAAWAAGIARRMSTPNRTLVGALWLLALGALAISLAVHYSVPYASGDLFHPGSNGVDPTRVGPDLQDFRDTVWVPGRYLYAGGNPYDTPAFRAAVPWTQGLPVYAPAWLLVALALAPFPLFVADAIYQVISIAVMVVLLVVVLRLTMPRFVIVGVPLGLVFASVANGQYALANVSTTLALLGVVLVVRAVWRRGAAPELPQEVWATSVGVALALVKPNYGLLVVVVALVARRWDAVWRGVVALSLLSLPVIAMCAVASGGPAGFVDAIGANLAWSTSGNAATSPTSMINEGVDLVSQLGRFGLASEWLQVLVPALALVLAGMFAARCTSLVTLSVGITTTLLLGFVHQHYDFFLLVLPLAAGLGRLFEGRRGWDLLERLSWVAIAVPLLHVRIMPLREAAIDHAPAVAVAGSDRLNSAATAVGLVLSLACLARQSRAVWPAARAQSDGRSRAMQPTGASQSLSGSR